MIGLLWAAGWVADAGRLRAEKGTKELGDERLSCIISTTCFALRTGVDDDTGGQIADLLAALTAVTNRKEVTGQSCRRVVISTRCTAWTLVVVVTVVSDRATIAVYADVLLVAELSDRAVALTTARRASGAKKITVLVCRTLFVTATLTCAFW